MLTRVPTVKEIQARRKPAAPAPRPQRQPKPRTRELPQVVDALTRFEFFGSRREKIMGRVTVERAGRGLTLAELAGAAVKDAGMAGVVVDDKARASLTDELAHQRRFTLQGNVPPQPAARGGEALYRRCIEEGYSLLTGADGSLAAVRPGGLIHWGDEAIAVAAPLIVGYLAGAPRTCQLPHKSAAPEAWTVAAGGALVCREHVAGHRQEDPR